MKKQIFYGFFAATSLMATSSLLSSCKDYSEDAVADLKIQQTTSIQELQAKINELSVKVSEAQKGKDGHSPYVGTDGYWYFYNDTTMEWEKSANASGDQGLQGFSAYEVYKNNVPESETPMTESEWLASLKGTMGDNAPIVTAITIVTENDKEYMVFTYSDKSQVKCELDGSWKCNKDKCEYAYKVLTEITKAFSYSDQLTNDQITDFGTKVSKALQDIQDALRYINVLKQRATSISVDGVKNNIFGMIKTAADVQTNMLFGFYGEAASDIDFPSTSIASYADTAVMLEVPAGVTLNKQKVSAGHLFYNELGTVYYTINPAEVNFSDVDIKLMNSQNQTKGISLSNVAVSSEVLNMGWTRAASASTGFYQSTATVEDYATIEKIDINADDYVALIKNIKSEDNAGTVNSLATAVKNTLSAFQTNAYALGIESEDTLSTVDGIKHIVKSPLSIQAALVKPLGYATTAQMPTTAEWTHNKLIDISNRVVKTIIEKVQEKIGENTADLKTVLNELKGIQHIYFDFDSVTVLGNYTIPAEFEVNPYSGETIVTKWEEKKVKLTKDEFTELAAMMNIQADNINDAIDKINTACEEGLKLINRLSTADLTTSVNPAVNELIDNLWEKINKFYQEFEYRFELALFIEDGDCKVATRSVSNAPEVSSSVKVHMSNLNAELLVPAYKKHLLCTWASDGDVQSVNQSINQVYDGTQKSVTVSGIKSGVIYELSYSGLDYTGKQLTRKFYVRGK